MGCRFGVNGGGGVLPDTLGIDRSFTTYVNSAGNVDMVGFVGHVKHGGIFRTCEILVGVARYV